MTDTATRRLEPVRHIRTAHLDVAYFEAGPADGRPVLLLHGFPYDVNSYVDVAPNLADAGFRVIVPYLRGHGDTRFLDQSIPRSGQQAALGHDVLELMDALRIPQAILAGYDWGGRPACVVAALWPERVTALVSVNGYLIQDISASMKPIRPDLEAGFWYFFYFLTERGRAGLTENRRAIAEVIWRRNSPQWAFTGSDLDRAAASFENPDFVEVVIHSYRHRLLRVAGAAEYSGLESRLAQLPSIAVPTITLDGLADGNFPARDAATAGARFVGPYEHRQVPHAGHNLPQESPLAFADAIRSAADLAAAMPVEQAPAP
ncbi:MULTISPECIES: alpha/beta fold hydrolase [unclassified Leifsonia]|uniref:alpha/beta fold hydrolase n=1 Tax=unclassified Leifsonia TaxID=2663824 RepID=UPI0006FC2C1F|nr:MULTISPECIES: alpha/beta hydrolase [unclassified Leifsonia]KQX07690.1 alpha/beta hydrolase [Leifsonia sp. Root1293]KRA11972.1 alpha/beta hydrolase [Leifsonia sp. Root60]